MMTYKKEYLETFLAHQTQLFDEQVAETIEEADEFLDDCMAVVADSLRDVRDYFEENGMDTAGLTKEELLEQAEVFALPDGKFLIVEG
ncbi:MAG: glyoxalase [Lachnospiraceae bacterium]|nr:glyoxalase [Lachnospiraceae bacterium]